MLGDKDAAANIAVKNLEVAKKFYGDALGLTQVGSEGSELIIFRSGNSMIFGHMGDETILRILSNQQKISVSELTHPLLSLSHHVYETCNSYLTFHRNTFVLSQVGLPFN